MWWVVIRDLPISDFPMKSRDNFCRYVGVIRPTHSLAVLHLAREGPAECKSVEVSYGED